MIAPLGVTNAADRGFVAVNQAEALGDFGDLPAAKGFDVTRVDWGTGATEAHKTAILANLGLKLTYTAERPMKLYAPANGKITFMRQEAGPFRKRTLVLSFATNTPAKQAMHVGRPITDGIPIIKEPIAAEASNLYRCRLGAEVLDVRMLFTITTPELDAALKDRLRALSTGENKQLFRREPDKSDTQDDGGARTKRKMRGVTAEELLTLWFDGISQVPWALRVDADADRWLLDLDGTAQKNTLVVQAAIREGVDRAPTGHTFLCNPGFVLRALGVEGDQAEVDNDPKYNAISGNCVWPVASGGTIASGGTNPAGATTLEIDDVWAVYGGSTQSVVFQPPKDRLVPGSLFSFSSAEDINLYSRKLEQLSINLRLWQPTLDRAALEPLRAKYGAVKKRGALSYNTVFVPSAGDVILVAAYATPGEALEEDPDSVEDPDEIDEEGQPSERWSDRAIDYPNKREKFLQGIEKAYRYNARRTKPAPTSDRYVIDGLDVWRRSINLNAIPALRPEHPVWGKQRKGQIRRLFPLRLEIRDETANEGLCWLTQDDVDCIRQEYVFHLNWTGEYYQTFQDIYAPAAGDLVNEEYVHGVPDHRITKTAGANPKTIPALGKLKLVKVPTRAEIRAKAADPPRPDPDPDPPQKEPPTSYRYTLLMHDWKDMLDRATDVGAPYAHGIKTILDNPEYRDEIMLNLGTDNYPAPPIPIPRLAAEAVALIKDLLEDDLAGPKNLRRFLAQTLQSLEVINRFTALLNGPRGYEIGIASAWRPPEQNESVSTTPNSNHQLGEAMDTQPRGSGPGLRNPLGMLAHHLGGQELLRGHEVREMLLEENANEYSSGVHANENVRTFEYSAEGAGDNRRFYVHPTGGGQQRVRGSAGGMLGKRLMKQFQKDYAAFIGAANVWPDPRPMYLELYIFALTNASHVHLTWIR